MLEMNVKEKNQAAAMPDAAAALHIADAQVGRELEGLERTPWSVAMDNLIETVDGLGERVVTAVADAAQRWLDARSR